MLKINRILFIIAVFVFLQMSVSKPMDDDKDPDQEPGKLSSFFNKFLEVSNTVDNTLAPHEDGIVQAGDFLTKFVSGRTNEVVNKMSDKAKDDRVVLPYTSDVDFFKS
ncbi:hypothetical protein ACFFRR_009056 [Megaselia abdita]